MAESFQLSHRQDEDVVILVLSGYLERTGGAELRGLFDHSLEAGFRRFVFDFSGLTLLNSQGLASLLEAGARVVEEYEGTMASFGCDTQTQAVLEMSSFFYLSIEVDTLEEALMAVRG